MDNGLAMDKRGGGAAYVVRWTPMCMPLKKNPDIFFLCYKHSYESFEGQIFLVAFMGMFVLKTFYLGIFFPAQTPFYMIFFHAIPKRYSTKGFRMPQKASYNTSE